MTPAEWIGIAFVAGCVVAGVVVSSVAIVRGAYYDGRRKGQQETLLRLRRLYLRDREAAQYELLTGVPMAEAIKVTRRPGPRLAGGRTVE